jgi:hypothetical protein
MAKIIKKIDGTFPPPVAVKKVKTKTLKRVYDHKKNGEPTFEGLFLSNEQLISLGTQLANIPKGPDGVCFMIGIEKINNVINKTVEVIPYVNDGNTRKFYQSGNVIGKIEVEVGKATEDTMLSFIISGEGNFSKWLGEGLPGGSGTSQRTPPPFS